MTYNDKLIEYLADYPNALPPGTLLNNKMYRVINVLGQGAFGITYLVVTSEPECRLFAVKEYFHKAFCQRSPTNQKDMDYPKNAGGADEVRECLDYFKREARMLVEMTSTNHRTATTPGVSQKEALLADANYNIVKVEKTFDENETCYFVMEYLDGGSLTQQITGPMDEAKAISLITPIAWAVQHLHENYIMHMDIKPDNIVLASSGNNEYKKLNPKLIDFGTTLRYNKKGDLRTTSLINKAFGTPGYCSREHAAITTFAPHLDVYSLGATLLHMLTGKVPKDAEHIHDKIDQLLEIHHVSSRTQQAIKHAMSYRAQDRTQSAIDFINELAPQFLPIDYILRSKHKNIYRILNVERQNDDYISYRAERLLEDQPVHQGDTKPVKRNDDGKGYIIHECFARMLCHRNDAMSVVTDRGDWNTMDKREFLDHVKRHTGLTESSPLKTDNSKNPSPLAEFFVLNNTFYSVKRKGYSAKREILMKKIKAASFKLALPLVSCIFGIGIGIVITNNNSNRISGLLSSCSNHSILTDSIETIDTVDTIQIVPSKTVTAVRYVSDSLITIPFGKCKFTGEVNDDGLPDGNGIAIFIGGEKDGNVYNGTFKDGILEGDSCHYTFNRKTYKEREFVGSFEHNHFDKGSLTYISGGKLYTYKGPFDSVGNPTDKGHVYDEKGNLMK